MAQAKTAKQRHIDVLLQYLINWENPWPNRDTMAKICHITPQTLRRHLTPADFAEVESIGLDLRLKNAAVPRANSYTALTREAEGGNVSAIKELLERTEGKVKEKIQIELDDSALKAVFSALPTAYAKSVKAALTRMVSK